MVTTEQVLALIAAHKKENEETFAQLARRMRLQAKEVTDLIITGGFTPAPTIELEEAGLDTPLTELEGYSELKEGAKNALKDDGINTLRDLVNTTAVYLLRTPNFGGKSLKQVMALLRKYGLRLRDPDQEG